MHFKRGNNGTKFKITSSHLQKFKLMDHGQIGNKKA